MRFATINFVHNSKKKKRKKELINNTPRKLTMKVILVQTILDLDDLAPSKWVQQTEVSMQDLDQDAKYSMMPSVVSNLYLFATALPLVPSFSCFLEDDRGAKRV